MKQLPEIIGYIGMGFILCSTVPTTYDLILGNSSNTPAWSMVLLVWSGLACFLVRSLHQKDLLYTISNSIGLFFQSSLALLLLIK